MKGFTILELLLSVAMIAILAGVTIPLYSVFQSRGSIDNTASIVANSLRSANVFAVSGKNDSEWGVYFNQGEIVIYKGTSYSLRDISYDDIISLEDNVVFSGINDIYFNNSGIPSKTGTIVINFGQDSKNITINNQGMINY